MIEMTYVLVGDPTALARPRDPGKRKIYDSQQHLKLWSEITLKNQHGDTEMFSGPIALDIIFHFEIPNSRAHKVHEGDIFYLNPNITNLIKYIEGVCKKLLYNDDCIIAKIRAEKRYSKRPRTEFRLKKL